MSLDEDILAARLEEASEAYYNSDSPLMSDDEFDALEEELRKLAPEHAYFSTVGFSVGESDKIEHSIPMLSMGKVKSLEGVKKWLVRLKLDSRTSIVVQPKVDGLSASLCYESGVLRYVSSRGDGVKGQNISHIARFIEDIPDTVSFTRETVEIRGELHLPKDTDFDAGGKPLRNNCWGLINRKDGHEDLHFVRFLAYQVLWHRNAAYEEAGRCDERWWSESGKIDILAENEFYTFDKWLLQLDNSDASTGEEMNQLISQIGGIYKTYIEKLRDEWNFETDGLIIAVDDNHLHDEIDQHWVVNAHHHYVIALKPPSKMLRTVLRDVLWQVSRQGNLTPVAVFDSVEIGGATVERASLHNAQNVHRLRLALDDMIIVERANDVIPYVRDNLEAANRGDDFRDERIWPQNCHSCGSIPVERGVNIACLNIDCKERVLQSILYWVRQNGIEGIALKTLETLYDSGKLRKICDLYTLKYIDFEDLEGFAEKKTESFLGQVASSRSLSSIKLIACLGIPLIQKKTLRQLGISTLDDFFGFTDSSRAAGRKIIEWKHTPGNLEFLQELSGVLEIQEEDTVGERLGTICLTGKAPMPRQKLTAVLEELGWLVAVIVTGNTTKVVSDNINGKTTKLKKARELGIEIVSYDDFLATQGIVR
ncbi:hypothetical protein S1OALGB6SA_1697 [Olavius algarvensis spirochete endosymbiont]|uniref:BRCT domain-containing protein n=1 Tax=Olavius algarvensis spirochete endosymbiont TaxID=260710 RepID=UPI00052D5B83|nr:BRCT domain-containing protein [Olavius algarvensis spirochete endosymbiont]KGM38841.1 hypothetical protein JY97_14275 [Alkalispirochaeta odontotermitis]VDB00614.1 hypothetical protein S1OALGB6SA_1697 [Olavius algarvensis spirochete endosymbiont]